jgi:hypothetical protein
MTPHAHGPENAEFEIRKAYNVVLEGTVPFLWNNRTISGVDPQEAVDLYKHAYKAYRKDNRLAAERWARAAKHLSRALSAEAKIAYLMEHDTELPFLEGGSSEVFSLPNGNETTADLLNSVAEHIPPGLSQMPETMSRYLNRARKHLETTGGPAHTREILHAERIRAAHEYGRVLEIMALAYEAEAPASKKTA